MSLTWVLGRNSATGKLFLADPDGGRFDFGEEEVPHIAAALAEHCEDEDERGFVTEQWGPMF